MHLDSQRAACKRRWKDGARTQKGVCISLSDDGRDAFRDRVRRRLILHTHRHPVAFGAAGGGPGQCSQMSGFYRNFAPFAKTTMQFCLATLRRTREKG